MASPSFLIVNGGTHVGGRIHVGGAAGEESAVGEDVPDVRGSPRDDGADCPSDAGRLCQGGPALAPGRLPCEENGEECIMAP